MTRLCFKVGFLLGDFMGDFMRDYQLIYFCFKMHIDPLGFLV